MFVAGTPCHNATTAVLIMFMWPVWDGALLTAENCVMIRHRLTRHRCDIFFSHSVAQQLHTSTMSTMRWIFPVLHRVGAIRPLDIFAKYAVQLMPDHIYAVQRITASYIISRYKILATCHLYGVFNWMSLAWQLFDAAPLRMEHASMVLHWKFAMPFCIGGENPCIWKICILIKSLAHLSGTMLRNKA